MPLLDGSHGNLANSGDDNIGGSSKLDPSSIYPYYSSNDNSTDCILSVLGTPQGMGALMLYYFIQPPIILVAGADVASCDNDAFGVNAKSDTISEDEDFIPQASTHANQNENSIGVELVVTLTTIKQGDFTSENHTVASKAVKKYFATSDYIQHSWHCIEILDAMPLASVGEGDKLTHEKVDELTTVDYYRNE